VGPRVLLRATVTIAAAATLALPACGGGGGGGGSAGGGGGGDLPALADQAQQFVTTQIESLATVQSKDELVQKLTDAQDTAHQLSNDIEDVEVPPELVNVRADLGLAMRTITLDIGRIRALVDNGDVAGAHELLANIRSLQALKDAIAAVKSAAAG
jgi:hypothetical protein